MANCESDSSSSPLQPKLELVDVLLSPELIPEMRTENEKLIKYLEQDSIITELAEWCFTTKHQSNPRFNEISEIGVSVLLFSSISMTHFLLQNNSLAEVLHNFLLSDDSKNPKLCGNFTRVISEQIKWGVPLLFINYGDSQKLLLNILDILAIRDLITSLVLSKYEIINSHKLIDDLCILADNKSNADALYLLVSIFKASIFDFNTEFFENNNVLSHLIKAAIKTSSPVLQFDIFNCISQIDFYPEIIDDPKVKEKITINEYNINELTIAAIDVLQIPLENLINLFFAKNATEHLHQKIISKIELMSLNELIEIANIPNFINNIINAYGTDDWCPHCLQIVVSLSQVDKYCKPLKSKKWKTFVHSNLLQLLKILKHEYGGHIPSGYEEDDDGYSSDSDLINDENKNMKFEEEEEFYDKGEVFIDNDDQDNVENDDHENMINLLYSDYDEGEEFNIDV